MPTTFFRRAEISDAPDIKTIAKRVIRANYTSFLGADAVAAFIESGMADKEIDDGLARCTIMTADGQIIGYAITDGALLHLIMIDVPFQSSGHGSRLLAYIENTLWDAYDRIYLQTFEENNQALGFYLKHGWHVASAESVPELGKTLLKLEKRRPQA